MGHQAFIEKIAPYALRMQEQHGIPASIIIAQAILETGGGKHVPNGNYFGIKDITGKGKKHATPEHINGRDKIEHASFEQHNSLEASVIAHSNFLLRNKKRYQAVLDAEDGFEAADELKKAGYATAPGYADLLKKIIDQNGLRAPMYNLGKEADYQEPAGATAGAMLGSGDFDALLKQWADQQKDPQTLQEYTNQLGKAVMALIVKTIVTALPNGVDGGSLKVVDQNNVTAPAKTPDVKTPGHTRG